VFSPSSYEQYEVWVKKALPGGEKVYIFGLAAIRWAIWKAKKKTCFDKKTIRNPKEVIYSACTFMHYWAGLYQDEMKDKIKEGADTLMKVAISIKERIPVVAQPRRITDGRDQNPNSTEEEQQEAIRSNEVEQLEERMRHNAIVFGIVFWVCLQHA
jgi:hypothetical protein